jgi:hypothetical protein
VRDDFTKPFVKIHWINLEVKDEPTQKRIGDRVQTIYKSYPNGGEGMKKIVEFVLDKEKDSITKRTDYDWYANKPSDNSWPEGDAKPEIPPESVIQKPPKK